MIYACYSLFGFRPMIKLMTAPIAMYMVGMISEMKTENDLNMVSAFLTNTAFNWAEKL